MPILDLDNFAHREKFKRWIRHSRKERKRREIDGDTPVWMRYLTEPVDFITRVLKQHRQESWYGWRVILKAAYGKPLEPDELEFFHEVSGGRAPPTKRVKELWCIVGRRGGKDSTASILAVEAARHVDLSVLRPGEEPIVACLACTKLQAAIVWKYIRGYFETNPLLQSWLASPRMAGGVIQLKNKVQIRVTTNDYRAPRGYAVVFAIFDEVAFFRDEESANPDVETYNAIRPGMLTMPNAMIIGISSPHMEKGLLFNKYRDHYGKDSEDVLVIQASTRLMNPRVDELNPGEIDKLVAEDPERAEAEYFAHFRRDLADYVRREVVEQLIVPDRHLLPPQSGITYEAYCDPSGGARDSMTLAIAHAEDRTGVLDCLAERRAPFKPTEVVDEFARLMREYGVTHVTGDRYGGDIYTHLFADCGVTYEAVDQVKSDMYRDALPLLNSGRVELLDEQRFINQVCALERRTIRGGRDSIDHPKDGHDDLANAGLGVLLKVAGAVHKDALWNLSDLAA